MEALLAPANSPADCRKGKRLGVEEGEWDQGFWLDTEDPSLSIKASKAHLTNPTECDMIFLINHPQPFLPSPDLRASGSLLQWSGSSPRDALGWLRAAAWLSPMCFWGPCPALCEGVCGVCGVCALRSAQHPQAQCPRDAERLPVAGLRAASPPCTGGAETEKCWEPHCYWSWECKAKI